MVVGDAGEFGQAGNIDQDGGRLQAKGQRGYDAMAASEPDRVAGRFRMELQRVLKTFRKPVSER